MRFNGSNLCSFKPNSTPRLSKTRKSFFQQKRKKVNHPKDPIDTTEKPEDNEEETEVATKHLFGFNGGSANKVHTYKPDQNVP